MNKKYVKNFNNLLTKVYKCSTIKCKGERGVKNNIMKRILFTILVLVILIIISFIAFYINKLNKIEYLDVSQEDIEISEGIEEKLSGYRNIVLFGIDDADGYKGRSDCIIIFSLNQATNDVKMTSIYRDTYVEVPEHGYTKINHAYAYGGASLAMSTINRNLDLDIKEFVTINFEVVKQVVDHIGGVELTITSAEATRIPGIESAGTYNLTGEQALAYGRIRKIDSDYKRTERMRTVISAVLSKAKKMSLIELNNLMDKILPEIQTNIQKTEITSLLTKISSYNIQSSIGWPYEVTGKTIDNVWYGVPKTLKSCVQQLHKELFNEQDYQATAKVNNISSEITKRTGVR